MKTSIKLYDYDLPEELIAYHPVKNRDESKLMIFDESQTIKHKLFKHLTNYLQKGDLLVLNDTKVIPGRLFLKKESGGIVEILFHKSVNLQTAVCIYRSSRKPILNSKLYINENNFFVINKIEKNYVTLSYGNNIMDVFIKSGEVPLPRYIKRKVTKNDIERYQTTYARYEGSVAAPTAGLHFTDKIINQLKQKGVFIEYLTLHVTYNTFKPLSDDDYSKHDIGTEHCKIKEGLINLIKEVKSVNKKVIAVGTTAARALENYASKGLTGSYEGDVDLYITPGYNFRVIDGLVTNFHLPRSTLLLMVAALIGRKELLELYKHAVENNYRFYSYGDSMLIKV
jgi:S-adenosylmethionine:tRNA ribosyltransferase-isomerase